MSTYIQDQEMILLSQWSDIRDKRNVLLRVSDASLNAAEDNNDNTSKIRLYRKALRDIPQTFDNPDDVVWPAKPEL